MLCTNSVGPCHCLNWEGRNLGRQGEATRETLLCAGPPVLCQPPPFFVQILFCFSIVCHRRSFLGRAALCGWVPGCVANMRHGAPLRGPVDGAAGGS